MIIEDNKGDLIVTLQDLRLRGVDFKSLSSSLINILRLGIFTSNGATDIQGHSKDFIKNTSDVFQGIESKKLIVILEKFIDMKWQNKFLGFIIGIINGILIKEMIFIMLLMQKLD